MIYLLIFIVLILVTVVCYLRYDIKAWKQVAGYWTDTCDKLHEENKQNHKLAEYWANKWIVLYNETKERKENE